LAATALLAQPLPTGRRRPCGTAAVRATAGGGGLESVTGQWRRPPPGSRSVVQRPAAVHRAPLRLL